jgi:hypothetical protein
MSNIDEKYSGSIALQFVISQGWNWKPATYPNIEIECCPKCAKNSYGHFYMECRGPQDPQKQRDSLFLCQKCGFSGNLLTLKQFLNIGISEVSSQKDWAASQKKIDILPNVDKCHEALLADGDALDYLMNIRGFSKDIIKQQKLGLTKHYFKSTGEVRALVYPYLLNGNQIWAHYRTLPDPNNLSKVPKDFASPAGWDATLYNIGVLSPEVKELVMVEGEANCIAALDKGILDICGVPGANVRKAEWIDKLDTVEKVYICYDTDKVGQRAAQAIASKVGIEKCYKIVLPSFDVVTESGETKKGKDLNEWFLNGGTKETFEQLKLEAKLFDVDGVTNSSDALEEFEEELDGKGAGQKYVWPMVGDIIQFDEGDCIHILAEEKVGKTKFAMNLLEYMVGAYDENGVNICLEMTRPKQARMWVSHKSGVADNIPKTPEEAQYLTDQFKSVIPVVKDMVANRKGELFFCSPKYHSADDIYKLIIDCIRRYGVKWIVLDNLQRLCDTTIGGKNRTQYLSEISKRLSQICKEYLVQIILILQPNRVSENKLTAVSNVDGASQVAKDCDGLLILNCNKIGEISKDMLAQGGFIQTEGTFSPEVLVTAALSRYSAGGSTMLYFDRATSTVYKLTEGKIAAMTAKANAGIGYAEQAKAMNMPLDALKDVINTDIIV